MIFKSTASISVTADPPKLASPDCKARGEPNGGAIGRVSLSQHWPQHGKRVVSQSGPPTPGAHFRGGDGL